MKSNMPIQTRDSREIVVFALDGQLYALYLDVVERVVMAVEVTPLPEAPEVIAGVINVGGRVVPVFNTRCRFQLPARELRLTDRFVIARSSRYMLALLVDDVSDVIDVSPEETTNADEILPSLKYTDGVVKLKDGMVLIHDLDSFLSLDEEQMLVSSMEKHSRENGATDLNGTQGDDKHN